MKQNLSEIINVDKDKCVNCHACISICPVKYCNDGSGDYVKINENLCIGCGQCIKACTHKARIFIDDTERFFTDMARGTKMIALIAPGVAANFPEEYLNLNGWLKSTGISAVFDVSFGAELTVRSYLEHARLNNPKLIIAQPCPAIVTYIEIYRPELLPYLAPADSPMLHTVKMIYEFYPTYKHYKIAMISPCIAKKREFDETGFDIYNITFHALKEYFKDKQIRLTSFQQVDYDNPPAERAVLFSTPGGLMRTAERWDPGLRKAIRKIEGPHVIYEYLDHLYDMVKKGSSPLIVDCLNCDLGCNGGTGTEMAEKSPDELEILVEKRNMAMQEKHRKKGILGMFSTWQTRRVLEQLLERYWKPGLYNRTYINLSSNYDIRKPDNIELKAIYRTMGKKSDRDLYNCSACGYGTCEKMATAIFNKLNKPENCHHYLLEHHKLLMSDIESRSLKDEEINRISMATEELTQVTNNVAGSMEEMTVSIAEISKSAHKASSIATSAAQMATNSTNTIIKLESSSNEIGKVAGFIRDIAEQLNLLALNATIEAARAGITGKGFTIVASEVKKLATETKEAIKEIEDKIHAIQQSSTDTANIMKNISTVIQQIQHFQMTISSAVEEQSVTSNEITKNISDVSSSVSDINNNISHIVVNR